MPAEHNVEQEEHVAQARRLYMRYGKPLEATHRGDYLAVTEDGQTLTAPTLLEAAQQATARFGREAFLFKVGERAGAVGRWR